MKLGDWIARKPAKIVLASLAVLALLCVAGGASLSTSVDYRELANEHGATATSLLEQSGFPKATSYPRETYQFIGIGPEGTEMVTFLVDWPEHTVTVIDVPEGQADLVAKFPQGAYERVTTRLLALSGPVGAPEQAGNLWSVFQDIVVDSDVKIVDHNKLQTFFWKARMMKWAGSAFKQYQAGELATA